MTVASAAVVETFGPERVKVRSPGALLSIRSSPTVKVKCWFWAVGVISAVKRLSVLSRSVSVLPVAGVGMSACCPCPAEMVSRMGSG